VKPTERVVAQQKCGKRSPDGIISIPPGSLEEGRRTCCRGCRSPSEFIPKGIADAIVGAAKDAWLARVQTVFGLLSSLSE